MNPSEYETLVAQIAQKFAKRWAGQRLETKCGRSCLVEGASGFEHQIDVVLSWPETVSLIECKRWRSSVGVEKVLAFHSRILDIEKIEKRTVHGVMATTKGYQSGALRLLKHYGIDSFLVKSANDFVLQYKGHAGVGIQGVSASAQVGKVVAKVSSPKRARAAT